MNVDVLGTSYHVKQSNKVDDLTLEECDGYCDFSIKEITVGTFQSQVGAMQDLDCYKKKVIRHELIHAFLYESGLAHNSWGSNEEIIDWIACQFPKILKAFEDAECL